MTRVVCAGHVNWDVTLTVDRLPAPDGEAVIDGQRESGGGSAANTAAVLAGLGCDPVLLGSVGADRYAERARRELTDAGVDCSHLRTADGPTTIKYLVVDEAGEVMVLANDGVNEAFTAADLPREALSGAAHLHLTSQQPGTALALAEAASEAGLTVSVDPGRRLDRRDFDAVLDRADVVFLNAREATTASEAGLLRDDDRLTVVKQGSDGAEVRWDGGVASQPACDVEPVDTTGAGDAFAAGFLAARLDGAGHEEALAVANACGALAVRSVGARTTISWEDIAAYREE
jgi:ribokinase